MSTVWIEILLPKPSPLPSIWGNCVSASTDVSNVWLDELTHDAGCQDIRSDAFLNSSVDDPRVCFQSLLCVLEEGLYVLEL